MACRMDSIHFSKRFIFDSSTIWLFQEITKGVERNPTVEGKKMGGLKARMMIAPHRYSPIFVKKSDTEKQV